MDIFKSALSYIIPYNFSFLKQKLKKPENNRTTLTSPRSINNSTNQYSSKHKESQSSTTKINFFNGQNSMIKKINDKINDITCLELDLKEDYIRENNNETKSLAFDATRCNSVFTSTKLKSNLTTTLSKIDLSESNNKNLSNQSNFGNKNTDYCSAFYLANKNDIVLKKNNSNSNSGNGNSNKVKNNTSSSFSTSTTNYVKKQKISISNNFFIKNNSYKTINNINKNRTYNSYMNTIKENIFYNYDNNSQQIRNEMEKNFEYLNYYKTLIIQCNSNNNSSNHGNTVFLSNNFLLKTRSQIISLLQKFKNKLKFSYKTLNLAISYFDYLVFYYTKQNFSNTNISNHSSKNRKLNETQIQYLNSLFLDKYLLTLTLISLSTKANEVKLYRLEELSKLVNYKVHINEIKRGEEAISKILDYNFLDKTLEDLFYMKLEECLLSNSPNSNTVNSCYLSSKIKITQEEFKSISFDYFNIINKIVSVIYYKLFDIMQLLYDFGLLNNTDNSNTTSLSEMIFSIIMIQLITDADCIFGDRNITDKLVSIFSHKIKDSYSFNFFFNSLLDIINN